MRFSISIASFSIDWGGFNEDDRFVFGPTGSRIQTDGHVAHLERSLRYLRLKNVPVPAIYGPVEPTIRDLTREQPKVSR